MNFINRLKFYLIGFGLGLLLVLSIFKDRNWTSWTPDSQVLYEVKNRPLSLSEKGNCQLECLGIDTAAIKTLLSGGDVNFSQSEVRDKEAKIYRIDIRSNEIKQATVKLFKDHLELVEFKLEGGNCSCSG